jgi:uncharacterized protein
VRSRYWIWILLVVPLGLGLARLRFDVEILNLLPARLPVVVGLRSFQRNFSQARELVVTIEGAASEETEAAARSLAQVLQRETNLVEEVIWRPPWMENPAGAMELPAYLWLNQPPAIFGQLMDRLSAVNRASTLNETRERLATSFSPNDLAMGAYDPYGLTRLPESVLSAAPAMGTGEEMFVSAEGTFRMMFVEAKPDLTGYRACRSWLADIRRVIDAARRSGEIPGQPEIRLTGRPAFVDEISNSIETDMGGTSAGTLAVIGILFWLTHRRIWPLVWLLALLLAILAVTLAAGGLFIGRINVVSLGFASILLGLAEDFGIVIYQESRSHPALEARELRREVAPGIYWSAVTTAGAFLLLNLSVLPGLGQLGSLVAIGIILASVMMLYSYTPLVLRFRRSRDLEGAASNQERLLLFQPVIVLSPATIWRLTVLVLGISVLVLIKGGLRIDHSPDPLKPKHSEAYAALDKIKTCITRTEQPLWILVPGKNEAEVGGRLARAGEVLSQAVSNQLIAGFTLPTALWPQPDYQRSNLAAVAPLLQERDQVRQAALRAGFTTKAFVLTEKVFDGWENARFSTTTYWPTNHMSRWIFSKFAARPDQGFLALGLIQPTTNTAATKKFGYGWPEELARQGMVISGWDLLGGMVFDLVLRELPWVVIPVFLLVIFSLWLVFHSIREVLLSLVTLAFSAVCLAAMMNLLGWDWNLINVMALPLLLGMGVDFSIHIQLAMRRYGGDLMVVRRSLGRALLLAGSTTVAGFGSLVFSSNAGMASLGKVCALGITLALLISVYLLPVWWKTWSAYQEPVLN